jgi:tetratricopeptide (TPR) repeat protein
LARPWLPDPLLWLRYWGRTRRLQSDIRVNRANITARRDLAIIWLEKRRPKRALPLLEEALAQDSRSLQLQHLRGVCLLGLHRHQQAVDAFVAVVQQDPGHAFGDPYLRAADALIALKRWDDAEDALEHFVDKNRSSVEGQYKRALVARGRGDRPAFKEALRDARNVYREVPRYQQRRQVAWYIRALFSTVLG